MLKFIQNPAVIAVALYWVYSAAISNLPVPSPNSGSFYKWFYGFSHTMAGNIDKVAALKGLPKVQN